MRRLPIRYLAAKIFTDIIFADSFAEIFYRQKTANTKTANQKTTNKSDSKKSVTYKTSGGFTLVELMIVIAIIGVIATFAVPAFQGYVVSANSAKVKRTLRTSYKLVPG